VAKIWSQRLGDSEDELPVGQPEKNFIGQVFSEEDGAFAAAGRTEIEALTRERPKVVITTFGIRTANPRDALEIIATGRKPLADLLDTLEAVPAVGGGVLLIVLVAEIVEVAFEDGVEVVVPARNVPFFRNRLCNS